MSVSISVSSDRHVDRWKYHSESDAEVIEETDILVEIGDVDPDLLNVSQYLREQTQRFERGFLCDRQHRIYHLFKKSG